MNPNRLTYGIRRRRVIQGLGWFSGSLLLAKGCASPSASSTANLPQASASGSQTASASTVASSEMCVLYPQQTEGPYYVDLDLVRQDITEGKAGVPLKLLLTVNDAAGCTPIAGAAVDIWHCDAEGNYAGYSAAANSPPPSGNAGRSGRPGSGSPPDGGNRPPRGKGGGGRTPTDGETFLRGTQITNANGQVEFDTIYPGWYPGRTTHIHFKVHLDANTVLTSQMYFPEQVTSTVYTQAPYSNRGNRLATNAQDSIMGSNEVVLVSLSEAGQGYTGRLTIGVAG